MKYLKNELLAGLFHGLYNGMTEEQIEAKFYELDALWGGVDKPVKHFGQNGLSMSDNNLIDFAKPYMIVTGNVGAGKTTYIKAMAVHMPDMQFYEYCGAILNIPTHIAKGATKIISIYAHSGGDVQ